MKLDKKRIERLLSPLGDKGYVKVGVQYGEDDVDLLMIHKDWKKYDFHKNFKQAFADVPMEIKQSHMVTVECPTLKMYETERTGGPKHKMIVDLANVELRIKFDPKNSYWHKKGLSYYSKVYWQRGVYGVTTTRKLDFISYHLIRWIHGDRKLREMALKIPEHLPWEKMK